jgi:hypothetical protein
MPPGPGTVLARIEDAVRETANDVVETVTGTHQASGTNTATVRSPSGAQGTATFDENVVTVDEYNKGMETLARRIAKLTGQVAQIRTGMLTQNPGGQGWDGAISWDQYQTQHGNGGGDMSTWMPLVMMFLLTRNNSSGGTSLDPTTMALLFMMPAMGGCASGGGQMNMLMPLALVMLLKK